MQGYFVLQCVAARPGIIQYLEHHDSAVEAQRDGSSAENAAGNSEPEVRLY